MTRLATALALVPGALAASLLNLRSDSREVNVVLQVNKATSEAAIDVWNEAHDTIWAQSCSRSLKTGPFEENELVFEVDEHGAGTIKIGDKTYAIRDSNGEGENTIVCGRVVSDDELVVSCHVPIPASTPLQKLRRRDLANCFPKAGKVELSNIVATYERNSTAEWDNINVPPVVAEAEAEAPAPEATANITRSIGRRQIYCLVREVTRRVGDGNPHTNPLHIQLSDPMQCDKSRTCEIGYGASTSYTVSWSAAASVVSWISGGFAVEKSVETGNTYTCQGNPGDWFALWKKVAQTAYTVHNGIENPCTGQFTANSGNIVMWSPNKGTKGTNYYCVYGKQYVRNRGDRWIDTTPYPYDP